MNRLLLKFVGTVLFTSLAFIFFPLVARSQGWSELVPSYGIEIVLPLAITTSLIFFFLQRIKMGSPQKFIQSYLLSITVKMILGCLLILIIIFMDRAGAFGNALLFILYYFWLTGIEIFFLLKVKPIN
jgi:hypothetical protein